MPVDAEVNAQPEAVTATLVLEHNGEIPFTDVRNTDSWTALVRGLREYISQLSIDWHDGTLMRLLDVKEGWGEPEEFSQWPSACVHTEVPGEYDGAALTSTRVELPDGKILSLTAELVQSITIDVWCTTKNERSAIVAMLEDALDPVEWMAGFHLILPYYHNAVATYVASSVMIVNGSEQASQRWKLATISVTATLPKIRMVGSVPRFDPRLQLEVTE